MNKPGHLRLFVTRIMQEFESDTFFPEIDFEKYKLLPEYPGVPLDVQEEKYIIVQALSTNLKYMKRTINVTMFSDLFQAFLPSQKNYIFFVVETLFTLDLLLLINVLFFPINLFFLLIIIGVYLLYNVVSFCCRAK